MSLIKKVFLVSALISTSVPLKADQIFTLSGINYNLKTENTSFSSGLSLLSEQPWWQNVGGSGLSASLADLVGTDLGFLDRDGQTRFAAPFALREDTATYGKVRMYDSTITFGWQTHNLLVGTKN